MTDAVRSTGPKGSIRARTLALLGAGLLAAVALAGCAGGGSGDGSGTAEPSGEVEGPTTSSEVGTTISDEEQAVIDAYLAELDAFYAAANPPNPDHPALERTATGEELQAVRNFLKELRSDGLAVRRGDETRNRPVLISMTQQEAVIRDCVTDADVQFKRSSGEIVDDKVVHGRWQARLVHVDGTWKVASANFNETGEPCEG